jgi:hypothetical protein
LVNLCETPDFAFPMLVDVYYPMIEQGAYGDVSKTWVLDKTIACSLTVGGTAMKEDIRPEVNILQDSLLVGRVKRDIRVSALGENNSLTNVLLTNIRDKNGVELYTETSGIRNGKSTIYEVATQSPIIGAFGDAEYYSLVLRRSENQGADV